MIDWEQLEERDGLGLLVGSASAEEEPPRSITEAVTENRTAAGSAPRVWYAVKGPGGAVTAMRYGDGEPFASYDFGIHYPAGNPLAGHDCELVDGGKCDFITRGPVGVDLGDKLALVAAEDLVETRWRILIASYRRFIG